MAYQFILPLNNLNNISVDLLPNIESDIYKYIFFRVKSEDRSVTRNQPGFIGCRTSQLIYTIICLIWKPEFNMADTDKINKIVRFIINVFNNCLLIKTQPFIQDLHLQPYEGLYDFIFGNKPTTIEPIILNRDNIDQLLMPSRGNNRIIIAALVQDPIDPPSEYYPDGYVVHYFNIIISSTRATRDNPNDVSIISSYGSGCVQIPQQKFDLPIREIKKFIIDLELQRESDTRAVQGVSQFVSQYFLPNGLITRSVTRNEETSRLEYNTIDPPSGKNRELVETILPKQYRVFIYPSYFDIVSQIIDYTLSHLNPNGGKKHIKTNKKSIRAFGKRRQTKKGIRVLSKKRQTKKRNYKGKTKKRYIK
jgi:hypothetical protein